MLTWWVLAVSAVALLVVTVVSARPAGRAIPDQAGYLEGWRGVHGGYDPSGSRVVSGWLTVTYTVARPLAAAGAKPDVLTVWTVWLAGAAVALAAEGGALPLAAAGLLLASALGDAIDGAVAVLTDRTSRWGYVLDSFVDRVADLLYVAALWVLGAPGWVAGLTGIGVLLLEYLRVRGTNAGAGEIGTITVGERPSRVIACTATLVAAGAVPARAGGLATVGLGVVAGLTAVGIGQLLVALRRRLGATDQPERPDGE